MINSSQKDRVIAVLTKHGLNEQKMSKGMFCKDDNSGISADLTGKEPKVGMMINGIVQTEGNSNAEITEIQREVAAVMKPRSQSPVIDLSAPSKEAAKGSNPVSGGINKGTMPIPSETKLGTGDPTAPTVTCEQENNSAGQKPAGATTAKTSTTTATCAGCSCKISGTLDEFTKVQEEFGTIYCPLCIEKADGNVPTTPAKQEAKPLTIPMCRKCGIEVPHARALACLGNDEPCTCEECGEKHESKHKETEKGKAARADPEEPKIKESRIMDEKLPSTIKENENKLTIETIKQYLCPTATDSEAYNFLQLCVHRGLNPFLREAYLIKYGNMPATMVVGKDAFTRKAEESGMLDGFEAGIIVTNKNSEYTIVERRVGVVQYENDKLIGGWAKIFRKDMKYPFVCEVPLSEYLKMKDGKPMSSWATMPGTMIRKVALVQALREAFTKELGGCYDQSEMGVEPK